MGFSRQLSIAAVVVMIVVAGGPAQAGLAGGTAPAAADAVALTATWEQVQPAHNPSTRILTGGQMAYNPDEQTTVFFGGSQAFDADLPEDTWVYSGGDWSSPSTAVHPGARLNAPMVYDPVRKETVMYGGTADYLGLGKRDTWTWDGSTWRLAHPTAAPLPRAHPGMAWDPVNQWVLLYGGFELDNGRWLTDTWAWDGSTWTELHPAHHPPAGWGNYMATVGDRIIDYTIAGYFTAAEHAETWVWTGEDWQRLQTEHSPPPLVATSVAGDGTHFVLFGGCTRVGTVCPRSTWVLHDGDWVELTTAGPSDRNGPGLVATGDGTFLLYGGRRLAPGNPTLGDTWQLTISTSTAATAAARTTADSDGTRYPEEAFLQAVAGNRGSTQPEVRAAAPAVAGPARSGDDQAVDEFFGGNMVVAKGKKTSLSYTMVIPELTCSRPRTFQITGQAGLLASETRQVGVVVREICNDTVPIFQYYEFADGGSVRLPFPVAAGDRLAVEVVSGPDAVTIETTNLTQGWNTNGVYAIDDSGLDRALLGNIGYLAGSSNPEPVPVPEFRGQRFENVLVNGAAPVAGETTQVSMLPSYGGPAQILGAPWRSGTFTPTWNYY
jgi:hypothetical protein